MSRSYIVTGGGRGVGRAVVERLLGDDDTVVTMELDPAALDWVDEHPAGSRVIPLAGDGADETVAQHAADLAEQSAPLAGWQVTPFSIAWTWGQRTAKATATTTPTA